MGYLIVGIILLAILPVLLIASACESIGDVHEFVIVLVAFGAIIIGGLILVAKGTSGEWPWQGAGMTDGAPVNTADDSPE